MRYKFFADTGIQISELVFGTMSFGGDADKEMSARMYMRCRDAGINCFDCADVYQHGASEEILGSIIRSSREELILMSKAYFPTGDDLNARGASRRHLMQAVEASLRRLRTGYLDIYFVHRFDSKTSLDDTLRALDDLVRAGKILYVGFSNFAAWQVQKAIGISAMNGLAHVKCIQPMYNLVKRQAEVELLPMAAANQLAVLPYSPLGGGLLTGKYRGDQQPRSGRIVESAMYGERYGASWMRDVAERFARFATENGYDPASLAVAWVGSHPAVTAPIIGARSVDQLKGTLTATEIDMKDDLRDAISRLAPTPAAATDRNEERTEHGMWSR